MLPVKGKKKTSLKKMEPTYWGGQWNKMNVTDPNQKKGQKNTRIEVVNQQLEFVWILHT